MGKQTLTRRALSAAALIAPVLAQADVSQAMDLPPRSGHFPSADEQRANIETVRAFLAASVRKDIDAVSALLADDCSISFSYDSPPAMGKAKSLALLQGFFSEWGMTTHILKIEAVGPIVVAQRHEQFKSKSGAISDMRLTGVFFMKNGKIVQMRDYELN